MDTPQPLTQGRFVQPETAVTHFHLNAGDVVADFGAGSGFFIKVLSEAVGDGGRVYACEIQKHLVEAIGTLVQKEALENVDVVWCDLEELGGTTLEDAVLDTGVVVNTLFQLEDHRTALQEIKRTLRSGGKLCVIDWTESFGGLGPQPSDVIDEAAARALIETEGFVYESSFDAGDHHYGVIFRKP